ncbi:MAG: glycosyltransferase [Gammaproteobacteria bacterium]
MDVLLVTLGTAGDVDPFLAIGCELKRRSHHVTLVSNDYFRPAAERMGLDFEGFGSIEHYRSVLADPDIWHPVRGYRILLRELFLGSMRPAFEVIERLRNNRSVLVAPCYLYGARIAAEKFSLPLATVVLQPASLWSTERPSIFSSVSWHRFIPLRLQGLLAKALAHFYLEPQLAPETRQFRRELGLPHADRIATRWPYSPDRVIGLFPEWFASPVPDWPPQFIQTGFVSHEGFDPMPIPGDLEEFLADGEAPIAFTPGSGNCQARNFFEVALEVCHRLRQRGLFLTGFREHLPLPLPAGIRHFEYLPFSRVFPRCKAIVHHGGIGTLAKGLAAGIPQLIMPIAYDQPDNALALKRLGTGDLICQQDFNPDRVADTLGRMIDSPLMISRCRSFSAKTDTRTALDETCSVIESLRRPQMPDFV